MFLPQSSLIAVICAYLLCIFSLGVSAIPQFGRPRLHVLEGVLVDPTPSPTPCPPTATHSLSESFKVPYQNG
ncbi:hypothetical protein BKA82DRAFT_35977 [Pisolithus tinctorius]|uniref:Uncharacterized protein n=1 Tax=Pisolithus tinctorius Marx 270 TaxID=870435 RepID=A0A0C3NCK5_PISTI|nr:hypothetical protein BKA82DRAFT_35977 [Pisolithus tinctorius]KIN93575.1 hypothetical protein M404DRAFT_35977 [Pisolithus tinctorius Marx 270]